MMDRCGGVLLMMDRCGGVLLMMDRCASPQAVPCGSTGTCACARCWGGRCSRPPCAPRRSRGSSPPSAASARTGWTSCGSASPKALTAQQARPYLSTPVPRSHQYQNLCCPSCCSCCTPARVSNRRAQGGLPSVPTSLASLRPGGSIKRPTVCTHERQLAETHATEPSAGT